jgi:hypothetical protein
VSPTFFRLPDELAGTLPAGDVILVGEDQVSFKKINMRDDIFTSSKALVRYNVVKR